MVTGDPRTGDHGGTSPRTTAADAGDPRTGVRGGALWRRLLQLGPWLAIGTVLVLIASMSGLLPWQVMRVDSDSMQPTIDIGDLLVVDRGSGPVEHGTVVAVEDPQDAEGMLVKRVVGVGGDVVAIEDGVLLVNGVEVCEPAIDRSRLDGVFHGPVDVPEGTLFLLSDNRDRSIDSRTFGPVPTSSMVGTVSLRLWPSPGTLPDPYAGC
ncbi:MULTISPECIES: signal peptidase I [unclassified Geodermatophilus]|uniref:signal peptidase I n=1 Tax=unclassified Geodermatophilus TaxID=2637632 RepID=UPI003EE93F98